MRDCDGVTQTRYSVHAFDVLECTRCGLMHRHPFPSDEEIVAMYNDPNYIDSVYFASQREGNPRKRHPELVMYQQALDWLEGELDPERRDVLDIGCGTGFFLQYAEKRGWHGEGVELSPAHAKQAERDHGVKVHCGDIRQLELPPASYDSITLWDLLEHVVDPVAILEKASRLLRPGGQIVILTINSSSLFNWLAHMGYHATGGRVGRAIELLYDKRHCYYFTTDTLDAVIHSAGLAVAHRSRHRAHLGRWVSEPAPLWMVAGAEVVDWVSVILRAQYRQLVFCHSA